MADPEYSTMYSNTMQYSGEGIVWGGQGRGKGRLLKQGYT